MIRLRHKLFLYALRVFDLGNQFVALGASLTLMGDGSESARIQRLFHGVFRPSDVLGLVILGMGWALIFNGLVAYETNRLKGLRTQIFDVLKATTTTALLLLLVGAVLDFSRVTREVVAAFWVFGSVLSVGGRVIIRQVLMSARRSGYNRRHVLILGHNKGAIEMAKRINANQVLGYGIVGFIAEKDESGSIPPYEGDGRVVGHIGDLKGILERGPVDELIICLPLTEHLTAALGAIRLAQDLNIVVRLFPDPDSANILERMHIERFEGDCVVTLFREQLLMQLLVKRVMDFTLSLIGIIVLSPLLLATAIAVKATNPGPVFFAQERVGMNKRRFKLYKFRSMVVDAEKRKAEVAHLNEMDGPVFKIKNDPRITPLGRFIRKTSIDELPQLFNVLRGQMSLVGPRPPVPSEVEKYEWLFQRRLSIKPGITCLWQISGRNEVSFKQWMEMDKAYVENWSVWLDVKILLKTIPVVLLGRGAS